MIIELSSIEVKQIHATPLFAYQFKYVSWKMLVCNKFSNKHCYFRLPWAKSFSKLLANLIGELRGTHIKQSTKLLSELSGCTCRAYYCKNLNQNKKGQFKFLSLFYVPIKLAIHLLTFVIVFNYKFASRKLEKIRKGIRKMK